jgi:hypothetical protein
MLKKIIFSPVTHFNLLLVGLLLIVGVLHNQYHHSMEHDAHGFVRNFCQENDKCTWSEY